MADFEDESNESTGGGLRKQLEAAIEANKALTTTVVGYKAAEVIAAKGFTHVKPADLAGVDLNELEAKAETLEQEKAQQAEATVRSLLASKGLKDNELDAAVKALVSEDPNVAAGAALERIQAATRLSGTAPSKAVDETLHGPAKIRAAIAAKK